MNLRALPSNQAEDSLDNRNAVIPVPFPEEQDIFCPQNIHNSWEDNTFSVNNEWTKVGNLENNQIIQSTDDLIGAKTKPIIDPQELIGFEFIKEHNEVKEKAKVTNWTNEGKFIIKFLNGGEELITYNDLINHYSQNQEENAELYSFQRILDHKTEKGVWQLKILWSNDEETWEPIKTIKTSVPLTVSRYAQENNLVNKKGFKWCKRHHHNPCRFVRALKVVCKAKMRKNLKKIKFGVEVPRSVKHTLELDEANGNKLWSNAIEKEINELLAHDTFIIKETRNDIPDEYQFIPSHMVLDIKFDGRRKARLVAGGNFTNPDDHDIYSGAVSIDSVRILLFIADLNKLLVIAADISNAYLHGKPNEKVYTTVNYGELTGKVLIIDKAQYGLKTSAARWHEARANVLLKKKFKPSKADMDLWMRKKKGEYEYIAVYIDDLIVASRDPMSVIEEVKTIGGFQLVLPWRGY